MHRSIVLRLHVCFHYPRFQELLWNSSRRFSGFRVLLQVWLLPWCVGSGARLVATTVPRYQDRLDYNVSVQAILFLLGQSGISVFTSQVFCQAEMASRSRGRALMAPVFVLGIDIGIECDTIPMNKWTNRCHFDVLILIMEALVY